MGYIERTLAVAALLIGGLLLVAGLLVNPHVAAWSVLPLAIGAAVMWMGRR